MKAKVKNIVFKKMPRTYPELVAMLPPRPIHDDVDESNVEEVVMAMAGHKLNKDQEDYLVLMSDLLLKYQDEQHPDDADHRTPLQRLKYLLDQSETTPAKLADILDCSQPMVSYLLTGRRELSKTNVIALAKHFRLEPGYFMGL